MSAPINVYDEGTLKRAVATLETPDVIKRVSLGFAILMSVVAIAQAIAIMAMAPLKERVPYFVEASPDGAVRASDKVAVKFTPTDAQIAYFIWHRAVQPLYTIDEQTRSRLPGVMEIAKGAAINQIKDFVAASGLATKIVEDPTLRQQVSPNGPVEFIKTSDASGVAVLWVTIKTAAAKTQATTRRVRLTVDYVILPVKSDMQIYTNPLGLFITGFKQDEISAQ